MVEVKHQPAVAGDVVEVAGHYVGEAPRLGEILEVLGAPEHAHYRVRWEDGHESVFYPGSDAHVRSRAGASPSPSATSS